MWCVRTRASHFRSAVDKDGIVAWSFDVWWRLDPEAATQFEEQAAREAHRAQRAFIVATGLGEGGTLAASMADARVRYSGGPHVQASHSSRV